MNDNSASLPQWPVGQPADAADQPLFDYTEPGGPDTSGNTRVPTTESHQHAHADDVLPQSPYGPPLTQATPPQQAMHQPPLPESHYGYPPDSQYGYAAPTGVPGPSYGAGPVDGSVPPPQYQQPPTHLPYGAPPPGYGPPPPPTVGAAPQGYGTVPPSPAGGATRPGWRRSLQNLAGGFVTFGGTRKKDEIAQLAHRVRQPIRNDFRLAVLSLKGGVGKTTVTVGLGSALASLRGDRVIAVDANPDLGTLARRIPAQTASTVRDLLQDPHLERYMDVRKHTSQAPSRLEVLASERDPSISEAFSEDEYLRVIKILENHYNMILTDCGTGLVHSAMDGVLKLATSLVLVTSPALDGAQSAVATLDWLVAHGYEQLARETVVVIAASKDKNAPVDINMLRDYFLGRTRAVQIIPYDEHLAIGGFIDLDEMAPATRSAFLELAATLVEPFAIQLPPQGYAGPFGAMMPPQGPPLR